VVVIADTVFLTPFSWRETVSTPDQVRGRLSFESALWGKSFRQQHDALRAGFAVFRDFQIFR
jgi:hypothetical protein